MVKDGGTYYVYGLHGPLEQISASGAVTYLHQDQLGSTRLLTDSTGANVGSFSYDAYGNVASYTGTGTFPLQYAGQYTDAESGLQYLRAREYDPTTGSFLSRDPAAALTRSPYGYVAGNPLNGVDATGLDANCDLIPRPWDMGNACMAEAMQSPVGRGTLVGGGVAAGVVTCVFWCPIVGIAAAAGGGSTAMNQLEQAAPDVAPAAIDDAATAVPECPIRGYTWEGVQRAISRDGHGVSPSAMLNVVKYPLGTVAQANGATKFIGDNAVVVLNGSGKVIPPGRRITWDGGTNGTTSVRPGS
jgi:RHS repeat-associated protein